MNKIDVIVKGDFYLDINLAYVKKNKDLVDNLYVLVHCEPSEITTYFGKVWRVGIPTGKWHFHHVLGDIDDATNDILNKTTKDIVIMDSESKFGIFERLRQENGNVE